MVTRKPEGTHMSQDARGRQADRGLPRRKLKGRAKVVEISPGMPLSCPLVAPCCPRDLSGSTNFYLNRDANVFDQFDAIPQARALRLLLKDSRVS